MIHIKIHRADDAFRKVLQSMNRGVDDGDGKVAVSDVEGEGLL